MRTPRTLAMLLLATALVAPGLAAAEASSVSEVDPLLDPCKFVDPCDLPVPVPDVRRILCTFMVCTQ